MGVGLWSPKSPRGRLPLESVVHAEVPPVDSAVLVFWGAGIHQRDPGILCYLPPPDPRLLPYTPQALGASFGLLFAFPGSPQSACQDQDPARRRPPCCSKISCWWGPGEGAEVDLGRECKASRPLCRWRTQDSAVVSWEALRHPAAVRRNNRPKDASYQDFSCISSASAPASALFCGSGQISPRDLKPCMQVISGFPFYHMLENYKYYLHLDTGSTLIWKWSLENTDFQNTKHQKNLWASFKPASADLILCFFSCTLFTFSRFTVGWRDSLNSFQHFMKLVPLFTCV